MGFIIGPVFVFFIIGLAIASTVAKGTADLIVKGILIGIGLMFVAVAVVFVGCAIVLQNHPF
jgi:hypothetical protein